MGANFRLRLIGVLLFLAALIAACGPTPTDLDASAQALAADYIAQTEAARPTETQVPTATSTTPPTATPPPTETALPSATGSLSETNSESLPQASSPTFPPATITPTLDPKRSAPLRFQNDSGYNVYVILTGAMYGEYAFSDSNIVMVAWGTYNYRVWINGADLYEGSFTINNLDKYTLVIAPNKVHFLGP